MYAYFQHLKLIYEHAHVWSRQFLRTRNTADASGYDLWPCWLCRELYSKATNNLDFSYMQCKLRGFVGKWEKYAFRFEKKTVESINILT